ncbi:UDP-N-acetylglucosamine 2-epimerase (non-hydrolyzing) [Alkalihalobacillus sp. LMS39]|uniref:non-hydrolyzing UDP-N-acetylglucosamine 2-epimerase n=1 Tax=Alkalihalobacillus sp. LMS39 TaxID=2924032 RepID=UPI001FB38C48|nr:UDP-N-acetylglucosamine 2-epimerase (non-hydrolyzing) [Alkalihalobacillus sp. LMS39]UOE96301.1 UDP-N-acetylglucosamine 2-epimerase (non-hydrolyzing) [Alkalihalobacillus sp. LMS39]
MTIFGTRPEGIKFAPVIQALQQTDEFECVIVNTGQHREILDEVLELFSIKPHYHLALMKPNQPLDQLTANMIIQVTEVLNKEKPDVVLVLGDTLTTFVGAYTAFLNHIPIGHIEAGLRTNTIYSPFPEEMYRQVVTKLSTYHFAPTEKNKQNLLVEGVPEEKIVVVGNSVIDALMNVTSRPYQFPETLQSIFDKKQKIILLTTHRRENFAQLKGIYAAINHLMNKHPDIDILFPVHPNPNVRKQVSEHLLTNERIHLIAPLAYESFCHVMKKAYLVVTDSGGIQEEAPALNIPVLVARESTERPEGVEAGTLKIVGTDETAVTEAVTNLLQDRNEYKRMAHSVNPYGDGTTANQIVEYFRVHVINHNEA